MLESGQLKKRGETVNKKVALQESPIHEWFELSYAQFLTVPRLVMQSMPLEWQQQMAQLLDEMDNTFDWRPEEGRYWVTLRDANGKFADAPLNDYRHGNIEHLRIKPKDRDSPDDEKIVAACFAGSEVD
jgi:hypothetical protein